LARVVVMGRESMTAGPRCRVGACAALPEFAARRRDDVRRGVRLGRTVTAHRASLEMHELGEQLRRVPG